MIKSTALRLSALVLLVVILSLSLLSCKTKEAVKKEKVYYDFFDTVSVISDYSGGSEEEFRQVCVYFEDRLDFYHRLFDIYHEYDGINNLATVNRMAGISPVKVDGALIDMLLFAKKMYTLTDGNVNVAMGSVLSIWHKHREKGTLPSMDKLKEASKHVDINNLIIDESAGTVYLADEKMSLDVGAIAKGYAVERIAEGLKEHKKTSYVIDVGGNLRAIGSKADGSSWRTAVQNPNVYSNEKYVHYLNITDTSVVTSGDYQRYYSVDGKKYHHIINKDSLMPAEYFPSVTIITEDSGLADALSTALFNMSYADGVRLLSAVGNVSAVWVTYEGEVLTYGLESK